MAQLPTGSSTTVVESAQEHYAGSDSFKHTSRLTAVLEKAWSLLRGILPGLPAVVLLMLSAREYRRRGHFAQDAWRKRQEQDLLHEVAVHPGMFESPEDLLVTILHEAAHALLWEERKPGDRHCCGVSLRGYYHRTEFRDAAVQLGLNVHFLNRRYGFAVTTWPASGVPIRYRGVLEILSQFAVVTSRRLPPHVVPVASKKQIRWVVLGCACVPQRLLRCPRAELLRGTVICGLCGERFLPTQRAVPP
jgi:hypothetical protein